MPIDPSNRIADLYRKNWSAEKIHQYIGQFKKSYFAYAKEGAFREKAASGGVTTAILAHLLFSKKIDGALVCRSIIENGYVKPKFIIARNKADLFLAQGSKYIAVDFNKDALPLIRDFKGRLAVTLLPCDTSTLRHAIANDPVLGKKIALIITLFCGHNSLPELTEMVVKKLAPKRAKLTEFRYRQGHWRGELHAAFSNGTKVVKPFSYFSDYQNLYFFCQQKCHHCIDQTGYDGDISVGDIWSLRMKNELIKHNAVIIRNDTGKTAFESVTNARKLIAKEEPMEEICEGQARSLPVHYNISARARVGKLLGIKIKDIVYARVRWNDFIVAWFTLYNERMSRSETGRRIIKSMPRFILKLLLYLKKGLESI